MNYDRILRAIDNFYKRSGFLDYKNHIFEIGNKIKLSPFIDQHFNLLIKELVNEKANFSYNIIGRQIFNHKNVKGFTYYTLELINNEQATN